MKARSRLKRGLSPLVATVLLISATVLGGMLVYEYFQSSVSNAKGLSTDVVVTAGATVLDENSTLVKVTVLNNADDVVTVTGLQLLASDGGSINFQYASGASPPLTLDPGEKKVIVVIANGKPAAVIVQYELAGDVYYSEPAEVS